MANTTFRRNYPGVVAELTASAAGRQLPESARSAATSSSSRPARSCAATTVKLRHDLDLAAAVIQRLTLDTSGSASSSTTG